ncbi:stealth family protein [Streptomyces hoynatensis]|uniref:Sugar phosphotransferase n=1 Tax=Streptomyces hoynatensis TaxID=1141874 RepID=A0A3A9YVC2_9ACTN|nr:stealth family protein [Streptomyces hoynatensis]RKN40051.1 sugar phosphotransferase [Streptomyces hoynatensis]
MQARIRALGARLLPEKVRQARAEQRQAERAAAAERKRAQLVAARRRALLAADPEIRTVEVSGTVFYGRTVTRFSSPDAAARNLGLVCDALEGAGIEYFLVPGRSRTRHVLGVRHADRKRLLSAMRRTFGGTALYAVKAGSDPLPADAVLYADGSLPAALKRQDTIRFGEILLSPAGGILADFDHGCEVEFWREGRDYLEDARLAERRGTLRSMAPAGVLERALVGPRPNAVTDALPAEARVPATLTVAGRAHPTFAGFAQPRFDEVDFPVDVVYTWVDGADPELAAKRESYRTGGAPSRINARETGASRYESHDELKYSLRSLEMYAPFVRTVHIVTDGQTPSWLNTDAPGVRIVDHKEIFADPSVLPVFNSHAIGTQLHRIPGLSERYLYFNDDVFVGRPVGAGHFFHGNGIAKLPFGPFQIGLGEPHPDEPAPNSAGKNTAELMLREHGRRIVSKSKHTPHPQIRAVMQELEELFPEEIGRTARSRFRALTDVAMASTLHHHHAYLTGRAVPGKYALRYIDIGRPESAGALAELAATRRWDFFCLNDVQTPEEEKENAAARLHAFLESYFPLPSRFER